MSIFNRNQKWFSIEDDGNWFVLGVDSSTGRPLGIDSTGGVAGVLKAKTKAERIQNMRLIAAAPQLLSSLIAMLEHAEMGAHCNPSQKDISDAKDAILRAWCGDDPSDKELLKAKNALDVMIYGEITHG